MRQLLDLFLYDHRLAGNAHRTLDCYKKDIIKFIEFTEQQPRRIDALCVLDFLDTLTQCRDVTKQGYFASLRCFFNWASDPVRAYLPENPVARLNPRFEPPEEKQAPTRQYLETLLSKLPAGSKVQRRNCAALHFIYYCGLRSSEGLYLRRRDVDLQRRCVAVWGKKTHSRRAVPLLDPLLKILVSWLGHIAPDPDAWLFPSYKVRKNPFIAVNTLYQQWQDVQRSMGVPDDQLLDVQILRHSFGTHGHAGDLDLFTLQKLMGHKRLETTKRYSHPTPETMYEKLKKAWA